MPARLAQILRWLSKQTGTMKRQTHRQNGTEALSAARACKRSMVSGREYSHRESGIVSTSEGKWTTMKIIRLVLIASGTTNTGTAHALFIDRIRTPFNLEATTVIGKNQGRQDGICRRIFRHTVPVLTHHIMLVVVVIDSQRTTFRGISLERCL